ncbi:SCO family protein KNAG_0K01600 [Huiozyma naganishii CBS 8797]|uniref:Thioredoxin domain-containing protein n=1 Tax=Huiozyma naganishii (strain ATCC MYA-139 / BCRC 22969 / CBS 8797 / KCTC 17520 / NBRC 10181 / NCYC 3082 / Yp74L-3) TaxID=1071383 RepID=J7SAW6_HUIN7|nr:hypothetical protein KNAG_0K01600 [Kazachstania naganishii CBS 8797]CCK72521.1 hypothetical protein KNAG_0K01600 [Kazachstania naganishii CBS 8797]
MLKRQLFAGRSLKVVRGVPLQLRSCISTSSMKYNKQDPSLVEEINKIKLSDIKIGSDSGQTSQILRNGTTPTRNKQGMSTAQILLLLGALGAGVYYWASKEKQRLEVEREAESNRAAVGGSFNLIDQDGRPFSSDKLLGKFSLLYFGFTHCPDICPAELDKMAFWVDEIKKQLKMDVQPIFVTCDPQRDTPDVMKRYLKDFHSKIIGLTGSHSQIKDMCAKYKVFFSTPENVTAKDDYIVDHSTFIYLIDPEGSFIDGLGTIYDEKEGLEKVKAQINAYVPRLEREKRMGRWYSFLFK